MEKRWSIKKLADEATVKKLSIELSIDELIANMLVNRGVNNFEAAKKFFRPSLSDLHDPFLMKDMDKAVLRLEQAIKNKEKVLIFPFYNDNLNFCHF